MKINFTKKQYEDLVKLVYLGTWMVNAHRTDDRVAKYEELEQYILSFYKNFVMENFILIDEELKRFFPTKEFEEETDVEQYIDEYNNDIFWEELIDRLARRDFIREYGEENLLKMPWEERFGKEQPFIDKYDEEFEKNGIENLDIKR